MTNDGPLSPALIATLTCDHLPRDQELALARKAERGDRAALERLIQTNARLAYTMAKEFARNPQDFEDYYSVGLLALSTAATRFETKKATATGARFGSFASWYIRQGMQRHRASMLAGPGVVKSAGMALLRRIRKFRETFMADKDREPTVQQIADGTGIALSRVVRSISFVNSTSLDAPVGQDGDGFSLHDQLRDEGPDAAGAAEESDRFSMLHSAINELNEAEQEVIRRRFGLAKGGREETLDEIARRRKLTRERIRQIEMTALRKIRIAAARRSNRLHELAA